MTSHFGIKTLSFAILLFGIAIETSDTKKACSLQFINKEIQDTSAEVDDKKPADKLQHGKMYWRWVCKDGSHVAGSSWKEIYEQKDEEPKARVQRGWGSRRRSSSSGGSRRRSSYSSSRRRSSSGWGSRRRTPPSTSRRRAALSARRRSPISTVRRRTISTVRRRTISTVRRRPVTSTSRRRTPSFRATQRTGSTRGRIWGRKTSTQKSKPKSKSQKEKESKAWDKVHTALDIAGMVPGIGNVADGVNAGLHAARGNWKDAALSAAAMIPGAGQAATAAKIAKKSSKAIKGSTKVIKGSSKVIKRIKGKVSKTVKEFLGRVTAGRAGKKSKNLKDFVSKSKPNRKPHKNRRGKTESTRTTHESYDVAKKVFEKETGVKPKDTGVTHSQTKDGKYHLTVRDKSKYTKEATMDVKDTKTGDVVKIRCQGDCKKP